MRIHFLFPCKLPGGQSHVPLADQEDDEPDVSLITGAMRSHNLLLSEPAGPTCGSSVVLRNQTMTVANAHSAGTFIYSTFEHSLQQKRAPHAQLFVLDCDSLLFLLSVFPGRAKLARFRAEAWRNPCGQSSEGQERHRHCL